MVTCRLEGGCEHALFRGVLRAFPPLRVRTTSYIYFEDAIVVFDVTIAHPLTFLEALADIKDCENVLSKSEHLPNNFAFSRVSLFSHQRIAL